MEFLCINEFLVASEKVYNGYSVRRKVKKEQNCNGRGNLLVGFTILWRNTVTWVEVKIQNEMTDEGLDEVVEFCSKPTTESKGLRTMAFSTVHCVT